MNYPKGSLRAKEFRAFINAGKERKFYIVFENDFDIDFRYTDTTSKIVNGFAEYYSTDGEGREDRSFELSRCNGPDFVFLNYWHAYAYVLKKREGK